MNFTEAVDHYQKNPTKENLQEQTKALTGEMTLKEKVYMLSGHSIVQIQRDMIRTGRNYNVSALPAGGCKRLGIPPVLFTDGPRGVVMGNSTCFPVSMLRASTFDPELEYRFGKAIADEAIAQGANYYAGICINLVRNPRWGRCQETYGEDPFLLGEFGASLTRSVQEEGMIACPKHFALNSIEDLRFYIDVKCDDRTLHEVYLPHFKKCIDAGALSIMGAYNRYDESYCCGSKKLLTDILREEWGFDGFVMSDFMWGCRDTENSLRAGLDIEMMLTNQYGYGKINKLLKNGMVNEEHVDRAVRNILGVLIRQVPNIKPRSMDTVGSPAHRQLALEIAEKGMVLLQNNGLLPLPADTRICVKGPYAEEENIGDHGSSRVYDKNIVTPWKGISALFPNASLEDGDVAVVCVGSDYRQEGEYFANTKYSMTQKPADCGGDRASLRLSDEEIRLIHDLKSKGKKVVVVIFSGSVILAEDWKEDADAIIMNYYSGCEGGTALARLLSGERNFSGKLPCTIAKREEDYPEIIGIGDKPYVIEYGYYHGYTLMEKEKKEVAWPFGFGLSYTTFAIADAALTEQEDAILVSAKVTNTGGRAGAEVVQVYAGSNGAADGSDRPEKLLKGFRRVELAPGETKSVEIAVAKEDLKFWSPCGWALDPAYTIYVGSSSADAAAIGVWNDSRSAQH